MQVVKRDGSLEEFQAYKIKEAIRLADEALGLEEQPEVVVNVIASISEGNISVEEIQDLIEN